MLNPVPGGPLPTRGLLSYGYRRSSTHTHQGVDIHAAIGKPVGAVAAGTVVWARRVLTPGFSGYGRFVVLRKGRRGPWILHSHMDRITVAAGQRVVRGQLLGTVGNTCFSREDPEKRCNRSHLHLEVSPRSYPQGSEETRLDPVAFLQAEGRWANFVPLLAVGAAAGTVWWLSTTRSN